MRYKEILKLKDMLRESKIPFRFDKNFDGYQITYELKGTLSNCYIIQNKYITPLKSSTGTLSVTGMLSVKKDVMSRFNADFSTAEDVFKKIKQDYELNCEKK